MDDLFEPVNEVLNPNNMSTKTKLIIGLTIVGIIYGIYIYYKQKREDDGAELFLDDDVDKPVSL
jgi:hypothetical protein